MRTSPEVIEAVPQSLHNEYNNRMKLLWATIGCMAFNSGAFFAGISTPQAGELLMLWMDSLTLGMGSTYLNYIRKEKLIERMASSGLKTTYSVKDASAPFASKGRNRLLRLMSPRLKAGIPAEWFK